MTTTCKSASALATLLALSVLSSRSFSEEPAPLVQTAEAELAVPEASLTPAEVEARRKQAEEAKDLSDEVRKKTADLYRQALEQLQQAEQLRARAVEDETKTKNVQDRVRVLRGNLKELTDHVPQTLQSVELAELELQLAQAGLALEQHKASQAKLETSATARAARRKEIRNQLLAMPQELEDVKRQLASAAPADEPAQLTLARQTELLARQLRLEQELPARQHELARYDAEEAADLMRLQRDEMALQVALDQKEFDRLNNAVNRQREAEARAAVDRARAEAALAIQKHPVLKPLADENQELAEEAKSLADEIAKAEKSLQKVKDRLEQDRQQFNRMKERARKVGLTGPIGLMLRKQRTELTNIRYRQNRIHQRSLTIDEAQLASLEYDERRSDLARLEPHIEQLTAAVSFANQYERETFEFSARNVLERQREYLDSLNRSYATYFDTLLDLDTTERELIALTEEYQNYIDERVLWIRCAKPLYTAIEVDGADLRRVSLTAWQSVSLALIRDATSHWMLYGLVAVLFFALIYLGRGCRRELSNIAEMASRGNCFDFTPTLRAMFLTATLAIPVPGLLCFASWRLESLSGGDQFTRELSFGLATIAGTYLLLEFLRQLCRSDGLARAHFDWPAATTHQLRVILRWILRLVLPICLLTALFQAASGPNTHPLEQSSFILGTTLTAILLHRLFSPKGGLLREYVALHPGGWVDRLKHLWRWAAVSAPLALATLSLSGYQYTARHLAFRMFLTIALIGSLIVVRALLLRLILVARRRLAIAEARRRRAEMADAQTNSDENRFCPQQLLEQTEGRVDFKQQSTQSRRMVGTVALAASLVGFWLIWTDVVPAFGFLNRWPLWTTTVKVSAATIDSTGALTPQVREELKDVTLAHVGLVVILVTLTIAAARNLPGLLEMSILQRLPLEKSVRYAVTSLAGYLITLFGVIVACNVIGLRWSQIQWLATALTFGLAFGLQEMFANFVAGIILLFERPIRVGDIVTVDNTTGIVSRIRIRATTIIDWDRKEFIVPNKEFITGKLLNWTLSDQVNRIVINVGVAYGTDTEKARELLLKVAQEHPLILEDPPSLATFEGFGDSCLNLVLRTYLPNLENRLAVIHQLHTAIDQTFRAAGIEIAFPQRDLHIRSITDLQLPLTVRREKSTKTAA